MIKIIKCGSEFSIPSSSVTRIDTTYDGIIVTLRDGTEIRFTMSVAPQVKAILPIIQTTKSNFVALDLDSALQGDYCHVVKIGQDPAPVIVNKVPVSNPPETTANTIENNPPTEKPPKKKGGRPKGSKTKKTK